MRVGSVDPIPWDGGGRLSGEICNDRIRLDGCVAESQEEVKSDHAQALIFRLVSFCLSDGQLEVEVSRVPARESLQARWYVPWSVRFLTMTPDCLRWLE